MSSQASGSPASTGQPRTRQRRHKSPPALDVPDIDQDAAERKRVLNVLAQRRYRERKRVSKKTGSQKDATKDSTVQSSESPGSSNAASAQPGEPPSSTDSAQQLPSTSTPASTGSGVGPMNLDFDFLGDSLEITEPELDFATGDVLGFLANEGDASDQSFLVPGTLPPSLLQTLPSSTSLDTVVTSQVPPLYTFDESAALSASASATSSSSAVSFTPSSAGDRDFPDSYLLPVHELTLLRGLLRVSRRIGCDTAEIWSPSCLSPFNTNTGTPAALLPPNWRPTPAQITVPHHPIIDFLPWPSARDRILMIFSLPDEARPAPARGSMALFNFVYDLEDGAEGVRIYGHDPCDADSWEIGQLFFERWWFLFDRAIVERSNRWRALRGAPALMMRDATEV